MKVDTTNPFNEGVTYKMFMDNIDSKTTMDSLFKKHNLTKDQQEFIKRELKLIKKK